MTVARGARYRSAIQPARASDSGGSNGPSLRIRATTARTSRPSAGVAPGPTTTPIAWRPPRPNGTRTASPGSSVPSPAGTA